MNDVIIVGGGLAGLAAGAFCARPGLRVKVLERAAELGGRARTDRESGYAFNQGGHTLYVAGACARIVGELGVSFSGGRSPGKGLLALARGELHRLPSGLVSMLGTDLFGFGAKIETARALAMIARADTTALRDTTWTEWVERVASRPEVRDALGALARLTTYADAPEIASAGASVAQIRTGIDPGVLYLDGGWQTLVDGLARAARQAGVSVVAAAPVTSITRGRGRSAACTVVLASGEALAAHAVVVATGPATARKLLGVPTLGADLVPCHAACVDLGLSALPHPERTFALGIDRPTYFSVHSSSARLADAGATIHVMKYLRPGDTHDARANERELNEVLDLVQPGWRERVVARRFLPNLVASNAVVIAGARRPPPDATSIEGAFVAGDWVGDEGLLADAALASAKGAAERAIAYVTHVRSRAGSTVATMNAS